MDKDNAKKKSWWRRALFAVATALKAAALLGGALSLVVYTNYSVDPSGLYSITKEETVETVAVSFMREGLNVDGLGDHYNERLLKRTYVNYMTEPTDTIVLGSSRAAMITKEMLGTDSMFNLFVTGAGFEDLLGFYGLLYEKELLPKKLVFMIDPWLFSDNYSDSRFPEALGDTYYNFVTNRLGAKADPELPDRVQRWYQKAIEGPVSIWEMSTETRLNLLSISYFQTSLRLYFNPPETETEYNGIFSTLDSTGTGGLIRADGSFSYPAAYRMADLEKRTVRAEIAWATIIGLNNYGGLYSNKLALFQEFLQAAAEDGVEVQLLLVPLSPIFYEKLEADPTYRYFFELEPLFQDIAEQHGISITGSYDPSVYALDMRDFYDGYHAVPACIEKIVQPLRGDYDSSFAA